MIPVTDTIRHVSGGVVDRDDLRAVQTPQGFAASVLRSVHAGEPDATDDAGLVEAAGGTVTLVEGNATNLKLTDAHDLVVAEALLVALGSAGPAGSPGSPGSPDGPLSARLP